MRREKREAMYELAMRWLKPGITLRYAPKQEDVPYDGALHLRPGSLYPVIDVINVEGETLILTETSFGEPVYVYPFEFELWVNLIDNSKRHQSTKVFVDDISLWS